MEMLQLNDLHKTFNPGTVNEKVALDITFAPEYERSKVIGHLFQDPLKGTAPNMTIEENLALAYLRAGTAPNAIFSRISRKDKELFREKLALLNMGLEDRMKQPVGLLSGGQRQALTLLMATLVTPKLLLLDEPTSALDPELVGEVLDVIKKVAAQGYTMLLVSHEMNFIRHVSNRVIFLDKGHVVEDGTPKEVFEHPQNQRTREFFSKMHIMAQPEYVI